MAWSKGLPIFKLHWIDQRYTQITTRARGAYLTRSYLQLFRRYQASARYGFPLLWLLILHHNVSSTILGVSLYVCSSPINFVLWWDFYTTYERGRDACHQCFEQMVARIPETVLSETSTSYLRTLEGATDNAKLSGASIWKFAHRLSRCRPEYPGLTRTLGDESCLVSPI